MEKQNWDLKFSRSDHRAQKGRFLPILFLQKPPALLMPLVKTPGAAVINPPGPRSVIGKAGGPQSPPALGHTRH